jgi:transcriptional regulator NrdR family protein
MTDTRVKIDGRAVRRRRKCLECQHRWVTFETVVDDVETRRALGQPPARRERLRLGEPARNV